jgi:hypothetical protein
MTRGSVGTQCRTLEEEAEDDGMSLVGMTPWLIAGSAEASSQSSMKTSP